MTKKRRNPEGEPTDFSAGVEKFVEFHALEPRTTGVLGLPFLPSQVFYVGKMKWTAYASKKWEDKTNHYIHEHEEGVRLYMPQSFARAAFRANPEPSYYKARQSGIRPVNTPSWILSVKTFVKLGRCIGIGFVGVDGVEAESQGDSGSELYCTPNGRALLVIQDKKRLEAIIWGGRLDVQARGIVY